MLPLRNETTCKSKGIDTAYYVAQNEVFSFFLCMSHTLLQQWEPHTYFLPCVLNGMHTKAQGLYLEYQYAVSLKEKTF